MGIYKVDAHLGKIEYCDVCGITDKELKPLYGTELIVDTAEFRIYRQICEGCLKGWIQKLDDIKKAEKK